MNDTENGGMNNTENERMNNTGEWTDEQNGERMDEETRPERKARATHQRCREAGKPKAKPSQAKASEGTAEKEAEFVPLQELHRVHPATRAASVSYDTSRKQPSPPIHHRQSPENRLLIAATSQFLPRLLLPPPPQSPALSSHSSLLGFPSHRGDLEGRRLLSRGGGGAGRDLASGILLLLRQGGLLTEAA